MGGFPHLADAHHSWNGYHWDITARDTIKYPLKIGDNVSPAWKTVLTGAASDWNKSVVKNRVVAGASTSNCDPVAGRTEVCNGTYGETGWLGLTQLWIAPGTEGHIIQATTKLNDTYFNTPAFNTNAWKTSTLCHELGHVYGLDHQDNDFNNPNIGSCLDLTSDVDGSFFGQLNNTHPNLHDYDVIKAVYNHKHSTRTRTLISNPELSTSQSDETVSVKTLNDGTKVITHIHWIE
jgi:hypothetical protein